MAREVTATDYTAAKAASSGLPITAEWRDGKVSVGGQLITPTKVVNGKAYVNDTDIDNAVNALKKSTSVKSNQELSKQYLNKSDYTKQLDKLTNRDTFHYDPDNDEVYQSYKKQYQREGARQTEDTVGVYSALTGGMSNSSAVTAAARAGQYWNEKLMDVIPELASDAYDRYVKEFEMDREALSDILDVNTALFDRAYTANRDTIGDISAAWEAATERDRYNEKRNAEAEQERYKRDKEAEQEQYNRRIAERKYQDDKFRDNRNYELEWEKYKDSHDRWNAELDETRQQNTWTNALNLYKTAGEIPNDAVASILGIPSGTVTGEMKQLVKKLAHESELAAQKYQQSRALQSMKGGQQSSLQKLKNSHAITLEKLKHQNTLSEIAARKDD